MALKYVCDCGKEKAMDREDLVQMGVSQKMYCKGECEQRVQDFLNARDELHNKTQEFFYKGMKKLYKDKTFQLPDEDIWIK